jgi:hypothetical protein
MSNTLRWFKSSYSSDSGGECLEVAYAWQRSSYSDSGGGNCLEVAHGWKTSSHSDSSGGNCVKGSPCPHSIHIRDSKNPTGPTLTVSPASWSALLSQVSGPRPTP